MAPAGQIADQNREESRWIEHLSGQFRVQRPAAISEGIPQRKIALAKTLRYELGQRKVILAEIPWNGVFSRKEQHFAKEEKNLSQQREIGPAGRSLRSDQSRSV